MCGMCFIENRTQFNVYMQILWGVVVIIRVLAVFSRKCNFISVNKCSLEKGFYQGSILRPGTIHVLGLFLNTLTVQ